MNETITNVLVVDDDDDVRIVLRDVLVDDGYQVLEANNGLQALTVLRGLPSEVWCLVLLDMQMPIMNGLEFLEELRVFERCSRFPVVAMSANAVEHVGRLPCVVATVTKPFSLRAFLDLIRDETSGFPRPPEVP